MTVFSRVEYGGRGRPGVLLELPEVLLPMLWWRAVPLQRRTAVAMTSLERFTIEMALLTGRADPDEFTEITGLPEALLVAAARRLIRSGALAQDGSGYRVLRPVAEQLALRSEVYEERVERYDVVLLPRSEDLLVVKSRDSWVRKVEMARPRAVGNAPVPATVRGRRLTDLLNERLADGTVSGAGADLIRVAESYDDTMPLDVNGLCPTYRCSADLRPDGERPKPVVTFPGGRREDVIVELAGADGLARQWAGTLDDLALPTMQAELWRRMTAVAVTGAVPRFDRLDLARWRCLLDGDAAKQLARQGRNLALPVSVTVVAPDLVTRLSIELAPADGPAAKRFGLDRALTAAAEGSEVPQWLVDASAGRDRAWQLGFYPMVYALRKAEDFAYG